MRRHALGMIAIAFLAAAGVRLYKIGVGDAEMFTSVFLRVGLVLGAAWLAWPQLTQLAHRVPPWFLAVAVLGLMVVMIRPRSVLILGPILAALAVLQFFGWLFQPLPRPGRPARRTEKISPGNRGPADGQTP